MRARGGMTLVELVTVLALLGVLTTLAVVASGPVADRYRLRDATELASQLIAQAQALSRSTGRCHRVVAHVGGALAAIGTAGDALVLESRPDADCEAAPGGVAWLTVRREALASGITGWNVDDAAQTWVEFRPQGRVRANGAVTTGGLRFDAGGPGGLSHLVLVAYQGVPCLTTAVGPGPCP